MSDITQILSRIEHGDPSAAEQLLPILYHELRKLAVAKLLNEKPGQTLQATALVHEAYLRLASRDGNPSWNSRGHFFGAAAEAMRRVLVDQARRKASRKAGGGRRQLSLSDVEPEVNGKSIDLIALDEALNRLEEHDSRSFQVVRLRYFGGLTIQETARVLQVSESTVENDWAYAKSWIRKQLS